MIYIWGWFALLYAGLALVGLMLCVWFFDGLTHRKRCRSAGGEVSTLLHHMNAAWRESAEEHERKKEASPGKAAKKLARSATADSRSPEKVTLPHVFTFSYEDHHGVPTRRTVRIMSVGTNGFQRYLEGYCLSRQAVRTFRTDRITSDLTDQETGELIPVSRLLSDVRTRMTVNFTPASTGLKRSTKPSRVWQKSVLFTGFSTKRREKLEAMAEKIGWDVRSTVGPTLDCLVTGPNAGPTKVAKANELGIEVIDEFEFETQAKYEPA
jgi:NAD-dependent DNA ligase